MYFCLLYYSYALFGRQYKEVFTPRPLSAFAAADSPNFTASSPRTNEYTGIKLTSPSR